MTRTVACIAAVLLTSVTVSTSCFAGPVEDVRFTLHDSGSPDRLRLELRSGRDDRNSSMNMSIAGLQLVGLDRSRLHAGGPLSFAFVRDAGLTNAPSLGKHDLKGVGGKLEVFALPGT